MPRHSPDALKTLDRSHRPCSSDPILRRGERDEQDGFILLSALNTGPRATGIGVLRRRSVSSRALEDEN